jgi:hypothetical protein
MSAHEKALHHHRSTSIWEDVQSKAPSFFESWRSVRNVNTWALPDAELPKYVTCRLAQLLGACFLHDRTYYWKHAAVSRQSRKSPLLPLLRSKQSRGHRRSSSFLSCPQTPIQQKPQLEMPPPINCTMCSDSSWHGSGQT